MSLLTETLECLRKHNRGPEDIIWVGTRGWRCSWNEFLDVANFQYHAGYGSTEVIDGLLIVGKSFWLERGEYDGSEWWEYKELPRMPDIKIIPAAEDLKND